MDLAAGTAQVTVPLDKLQHSRDHKLLSAECLVRTYAAPHKGTIKKLGIEHLSNLNIEKSNFLPVFTRGPGVPGKTLTV